MKNHLNVMLTDKTSDYLETCARIRGIKRTSLVRRLLDVIAKDALVGGILDDEAHIRRRRVGDWKHKPIEQGSDGHGPDDAS